MDWLPWVLLLLWAMANVVVAVAVLSATAWSRALYGIGRRSPIVVTTRKRHDAHFRNGFELGLRTGFELGGDTERYISRPPEETPPKRRHLSVV
jgi:hypothetical protein